MFLFSCLNRQARICNSVSEFSTTQLWRYNEVHQAWPSLSQCPLPALQSLMGEGRAQAANWEHHRSLKLNNLRDAIESMNWWWAWNPTSDWLPRSSQMWFWNGTKSSYSLHRLHATWEVLIQSFKWPNPKVKPPRFRDLRPSWAKNRMTYSVTKKVGFNSH
jgi:hypothetical protein